MPTTARVSDTSTIPQHDVGNSYLGLYIGGCFASGRTQNCGLRLAHSGILQGFCNEARVFLRSFPQVNVTCMGSLGKEAHSMLVFVHIQRYRCRYIYIYRCIHTCTYVYTSVYIYMCTHSGLYIFAHIQSPKGLLCCRLLRLIAWADFRFVHGARSGIQGLRFDLTNVHVDLTHAACMLRIWYATERALQMWLGTWRYM